MTDPTEATRRANHAVLDDLAFDDVADGIYQVRNLDLATMSIIRGETGSIVVDP